MTYEDYQNIMDTLPKEPGVYKFIGADGDVLYVGKAKNLKNRVSNYFTSGKNQMYRTRVMVKNADHVEVTIVDTEHDALLLESTLIKKHQPRYNVQLKDGKSYTYICVKKERFPRVFFTRRVIRDGSDYYGPYTSKFRAKIILEVIRSLFPLRTCSYNLSQSNIESGKIKVCLEYHIKNCMAPCELFETEEQYMDKIKQVKNMLKGQFSAVKRHLKEEMKIYSENMEFEKAHQAKIRLDAFDDYQSKSTVVSATIRDVDVFTLAQTEKVAYVNYMKVVKGAVINTYTIEMVKNLNEEPEDLLSHAIIDLRNKFNSIAPEIIVPMDVTTTDDQIVVTVPQRGEKKKLLDLAQKNAEYMMLQMRRDEASTKRKQGSAERILTTLKNDLQMDEMPLHIECFDNSNLQGTHPVASCVVFKNAKPSKRDYRHFNIKTVEGPDDFASMEEIVFRRYKRLLKEDQSLPQLVIIDGGKGQLSSAMNSIKELNLEGKITVIGIAKRLEEIYFSGDSIPLYINKKSESLKLIQQARNEAHRFAINFHRDKRSKDMIKTELTGIKGIGEKTSKKLLQKYGSVKRISELSKEELEAELNLNQALAIWKHFGEEE